MAIVARLQEYERAFACMCMSLRGMFRVGSTAWRRQAVLGVLKRRGGRGHDWRRAGGNLGVGKAVIGAWLKCGVEDEVVSW